ncbi:hypothetical protein EJB05_49878 [Eragrostis curvula]|uniref:TIR domain-containing protein n=1 Tax=Eragrostis curvula TaxID=38414 RepID=A0A5J9T5W6_9POAL|nr:hypothetical protein EJB05_49878 [Eragrostis curvula]
MVSGLLPMQIHGAPKRDKEDDLKTETTMVSLFNLQTSWMDLGFRKKVEIFVSYNSQDNEPLMRALSKRINVKNPKFDLLA